MLSGLLTTTESHQTVPETGGAILMTETGSSCILAAPRYRTVTAILWLWSEGQASDGDQYKPGDSFLQLLEYSISDLGQHRSLMPVDDGHSMFLQILQDRPRTLSGDCELFSEAELVQVSVVNVSMFYFVVRRPCDRIPWDAIGVFDGLHGVDHAS